MSKPISDQVLSFTIPGGAELPDEAKKVARQVFDAINKAVEEADRDRTGVVPA